LSFFFPSLLIYVNLFISLLAGVAITNLARRRWALRFLRNLSLLVIFCGLLFSAVAQAKAIATMVPSSELITELRQLAILQGIVLSHPKNGFWISYAGFPIVIDQKNQDAERLQDVFSLFATTDLHHAKELLQKYNVSYVLVTPEMTSGAVWRNEEQGLAFLLTNNETFKRLETGSAFGLWEVQR
jgi:hypothetical protein